MTRRTRWCRVRPTASVATALLVAVVGVPASAAPPVGGYTTTLLTTGSEDLPHAFLPSTTGNPVTEAGLVAGSTTVGDFRSVTAAGVYDLHAGTWTRLGTLPGGANAWAADVNEGGDAVGRADVDLGGPTRAFLWTRARPTLLDLGSLDREDPNSAATAVNDHGVVVGWTYTPDSGSQGHAFLWDPKASPLRMRDLGTLGGVDSVANGINNAGTVVGMAETRRHLERPVLWTAGQHTVVDLGTLPGYDSGVARDVNDRGYVVGEVFNAATPKDRRAFVWSPLTRTLTALRTPTGQASRAYAINHHGVVTGSLSPRPTSADGLPAIWNACTPLTVLPATVGQATGVTRRELIVGSSGVSGVSWRKAGPCT